MLARVCTSQNWAWKALLMSATRNLLSTVKPPANSLRNSRPSDCDLTVMPLFRDEVVTAPVAGFTLSIDAL